MSEARRCWDLSHIAGVRWRTLPYYTKGLNAALQLSGPAKCPICRHEWGDGLMLLWMRMGFCGFIPDALRPATPADFAASAPSDSGEAQL